MTKDEADLIITEQNKSTEEILKAVAKVKADYHELCKLKDMRIAELEKEVDEVKLKSGYSTYLEDKIKIDKLEKENAELKNRDCWKSCEYANPKAELIGQHIKDVQNLTKAKEIIKELYKGLDKLYLSGLSDKQIAFVERLQDKTEQFLKEVLE